jgi:AcrR family transcriptional regulator
MTMEQRTGGTPTVERILQSAETEFAENGFATGRIQEIATNAGVTKQLVYHYFQNKEELYQQVLERISDQYDDLFNSKDYDDLTSEAAIRQFVCRHFQLHAGNGGNLLRDVAMHSGEVLHLSRRRHQLVKAVHDCLDRIVVRGREERVFNDRQDTSELLLMINIITNGAVATGPALIGIMAPDLPSCPKRKALEDLSARFILSALTH